ncbi:SR34A, partial [Symbiodinium microadriaticum]
YGRIKDIDLKTPSRPPAFAFVSFEYQEDADAAIRGRDGYDFDGNRLRVEYSKGSRGGDRRDTRDRGRGGGRRSEWQVLVSRLPRSCSWQDLKDFMRKAGDVIYADVDRNGDGVVEYSNESDMENAVRKLDDTEFKNPFDKSFVRVKFGDDRRAKRDRSRSRSRDRSRRSRSRSRGSRSRSDSRDRREKDRSPSRSMSEDRARNGDKDRKTSPRRSVSRGRSPDSRDRSKSRSHSSGRGRDRDRSQSASVGKA